MSWAEDVREAVRQVFADAQLRARGIVVKASDERDAVDVSPKPAAPPPRARRRIVVKERRASGT
jgi:hypothetical protein